MKRANWSFPLRVKKIPLFAIKKVYGHDYWVRRRVDKREGARERAAPHSRVQARGFAREPFLPEDQTYSHLTGTGNTVRNIRASNLHSENGQSGFYPSKSNSKEGLASLKTGENWGTFPSSPLRSPLAAAWWPRSAAGRENTNRGNDLLFKGKKYVSHARRSPWYMTKAIILTMILNPLHN